MTFENKHFFVHIVSIYLLLSSFLCFSQGRGKCDFDAKEYKIVDTLLYLDLQTAIFLDSCRFSNEKNYCFYLEYNRHNEFSFEFDYDIVVVQVPVGDGIATNSIGFFKIEEYVFFFFDSTFFKTFGLCSVGERKKNHYHPEEFSVDDPRYLPRIIEFPEFFLTFKDGRLKLVYCTYG